jgi:selenide,water dikinase
VEPIYGLAVTGVVDPALVKRNSGARPGDVIILGKPLGVGIFSAALKKGLLEEGGYRAMIELTTQLNLPGEALARLGGVHAMTDVTGFGLLGHLLEMCRGSALAAHLDGGQMPLLHGALELAQAGITTGASMRNWQSYGDEVRLAPTIDGALRAILTDPQTSGGLLVACAGEAVAGVLEIFKRFQFERATVIGRFAGPGSGIDVT